MDLSLYPDISSEILSRLSSADIYKLRVSDPRSYQAVERYSRQLVQKAIDLGDQRNVLGFLATSKNYLALHMYLSDHEISDIDYEELTNILKYFIDNGQIGMFKLMWNAIQRDEQEYVRNLTEYGSSLIRTLFDRNYVDIMLWIGIQRESSYSIIEILNLNLYKVESKYVMPLFELGLINHYFATHIFDTEGQKIYEDLMANDTSSFYRASVYPIGYYNFIEVDNDFREYIEPILKKIDDRKIKELLMMYKSNPDMKIINPELQRFMFQKALDYLEL